MALSTNPKDVDVEKILASGETIWQRVKAKLSQKNFDKETLKQEAVENAYKECLMKIYEKALMTNEKSDHLWEKVWLYAGWYTEWHHKALLEIGNSIKKIFDNWQQERLAEDLHKQGLQLRFSYAKWDINEHATKLTIDDLKEFPKHKHGNPLRIFVKIK